MSQHQNQQSGVAYLIKLSFKILLVGGLLYFLTQKGFISIQDTGRAFTRWDLLVPAFLVMLLNVFLSALRWQWLLEAQGIHISLTRNFQLSFIGNFFNIALPGAVSGDLIKAFYIGKEVSGNRGRAFGAILFDRVAGLSALVLVSAVAVIFGHAHLAPSVVLGTRTFLWTAAFFVVSFYVYLFLLREHHDPVLRILKTIESRMPKFASIVRIYQGMRHYHHHRVTVMKVLAISLVIHLLVGWVCLQFAQALGETGLELLPTYVVVPLGLLITAVPIAPAGVGTGHAAFSYLFSLMGSARGADLYTLFALANICLGALGGIVYLRFKSHEPAPILV